MAQARLMAIVYLAGFCGLPTLGTSGETLYESVCRKSRAISSGSLVAPLPPAHWEETVSQRREMWREMLGLSPLPERTPLEATVTGVLDRGDYVVEKIHFQSVPGAYVAGNLYRPATVTERLPAVLYLCGHTLGKVNPPYQANPRWFGQHGYVALVLDPIQRGESQGLHHGTYREGFTRNWARVIACRSLPTCDSGVHNDRQAVRLGLIIVGTTCPVLFPASPSL